MSTETSQRPGIARGSRVTVSRGLATVLVALGALVVASALLAPTSLSRGPVLAMLPFAAVLAVAAVGQTFVVMQGGIDLSVAGSISMVVVIITHQAYGDNSQVLPAALTALGIALAAGLLNGILVGILGLNAIVATIGTNALLYAVVLGVSGGTPRETTSLMADIAGGSTFGVPHSVYFAVLAVALATVVVKRTAPGRRFEAVGANGRAAAAAGLPVREYKAAAYMGAQVFYWGAGFLLAGIINKPTAFQGDAYLLASVAAVVLGGTSLLGGRGNIVSSALAALFLTQLDQFVLALGVDFAARTLVQAAAFAVGVAIYTIDWNRLRRVVSRPGPVPPAEAST